MSAPAAPAPSSVARSAIGVVRRAPFEAAVVIAGVVYWALALSPSSYALALRFFGVSDTRTWLGSAKVERWDEWAVQTPMVQAVVRSDHGTVNTTSYYEESFRNLVALPLFDWAIVLRPFEWGYLFLPPAWGFSFYWASTAVLTLVGWSVLLRRLGATYWLAVAASLVLFFAPFTQTWWSGLAPMNALFPWLIVLCTSRLRLWIAAPLMAWLCASWVVSSAYLPGLVLYAFLGLVLLGGFVVRRDVLRRLLVLGGAAAVGGAVALAYLAPVLRELAGTVYPGQRVTPSGGLDVGQWLSQFVPFGVTRGSTSLISTNLPEAVALGSWLPLLTLCLVDWRRTTREDLRRIARPVGACLLGFVLLSAWQLSTAAGLIGRVFGWDRAAVQRSLLISGPLLVIAAVVTLSSLPTRLTWLRALAFAAVGLALSLVAAALTPSDTHDFLGRARDDLWIVPVAVALAAVVWLVGRTDPERLRRPGALGAAALAVALPGIALWALYNPVQDSRIIFEPLATPVTAELDAAAAVRDDHAIAANFPGATLNGQGYRSMVHVLPLPQLDTFRAMFPDEPDEVIDELFNRYVELTLVDGDHPVLLGQGVVGLPRERAAELATLVGG